MKSSRSATSDVLTHDTLPELGAVSGNDAALVRPRSEPTGQTPTHPKSRAAVSRLAALLAGLWAGVLLTISIIATPVPFAVLERTAAGRVVGVIFMIEAYVSVVFAVLLFLAERGKARRAAEEGQGSVLSGTMLLALGALFCTVLGYFALQPLMAQAKLGQGPLSFGALHAISTVVFGIKTLLVLILGWRLSGR